MVFAVAVVTLCSGRSLFFPQHIATVQGLPDCPALLRSYREPESTTQMPKLLKGVEAEWTVLGNESFVEVANTGRKPVKNSLRVSGKTPYYGANNIQNYVEGHTHNGEFVLIAEDGSASLENYSIQYATGRFWANNYVHVVRGKSGLNSRFL